MDTFENFLKDIHADDFTEGVLDDDMGDDFDNWIQSQDVQDIMDYAESYGKAMYKLGASDAVNEANRLSSNPN